MKLSKAISEFNNMRQFRGSPLTSKRYDHLLRIFCICMHDPELEELGHEHIVWYLMEMRRMGWAPNGINVVAIALRKFFEFCNLRGFETFSEQLIPIPKKEFNIPRVATQENFRKLMKELPHGSNRPHHLRNKALLMLLWDTGARVGEIVSLDVEDLDTAKRTALIRTEKSRGRRPVRQIFWTPETNTALKKWVKKKEELQRIDKFRDTEALFISISKTGLYDTRGKRMTNRGVAGVLQMLSNRAELPVLNAHSIRHSMGRDTVRKLRSNSAVSNMLGHSSLDSSYIYTMIWGEDLREDWEIVMQERGIASKPQRSTSFPKNRRESGTQGSIRPVVVNSRSGRMARS
jgi:site-specific recombinase XerD